MKIIQSFFANDTSRPLRTNVDIASKQANISNKFLKKHNYDTILYTDQQSAKYFYHIKYDEIKIIDLKEFNIKDKLNFWSITKLLCSSLVKDNFLHIDLDLFLIQDIIKDHKNEQFICLHHEPWMTQIFYEELSKEKIKKYFDIDSEKAKSYNFSIFGGNNNSIINSCITKLNNYIDNHNNEINNLLLRVKNNKHNLKKAVFLEQYIFPSLVSKTLNIDMLPVLVPDSINARGQAGIRTKLKEQNIIHIWTLKETIEDFIGINLFLDMIEKYYF